MDTRPDCRYGSLCYQKNPEHHAKFRHSFKRKERNSDTIENDGKKIKLTNKPRTSNTTKKTTSPSSSKIPVTKVTSPGQKNQLSEDHQNNDINPGKSPDKRKKGGNNSPKNSKPDDSDIEDEIPEAHSTTQLNTSSEANVNISSVLIEDKARLKTLVQEKYLVEMPEEFFTFWKLCQKISPKSPKDAFKCLDLKLVGPFDILNGQVVEDGLMVTHWRYFYDPPEFQTLIASISKDGLHYGYFRDEPDKDPVFIASNSNKDCKINPVASNIFTFITQQIDEKLNSKSCDSSLKSRLTSVKQKLTDFAHCHKIDLSSPKLNTVVRARNGKTVCKGLSGVGIVVPYEKKTELGYRPLQKSDKDLETLFRQYRDPTVEPHGRLKLKSMLQEVCTWVTIAIDESDFGTGLEFGLDLFGSGVTDLHSMAKCTLAVAYQYLNREEFGTILEAHLANRNQKYVNLFEKED